MTDEQLSEIIDRILKAEADICTEDEEYLERSRIVRIIRGLEEEK